MSEYFHAEMILFCLADVLTDADGIIAVNFAFHRFPSS